MLKSTLVNSLPDIAIALSIIALIMIFIYTLISKEGMEEV